MAAPGWWGTRRFGLFVHANLATVPAWAPIGEYADWYAAHLGEPVADVLLHPTPMVEVLAHHRDRWGHVDRLDDFWPLLTFERFDADEWTDLAVDAGMSYTVMVAKHHDGLCWWDAPNTDRTVVAAGPRRNVLAEYAAASERAGVVFGTYYSLLDWADSRYPGQQYVDQVLHPQVLDLVERYGSRIAWGDGHWGHGPDHWRSDELIAKLREVQPELIVNDRWWASDADVTVYEYQTPDDILDRPWELCRGLGHSFCHNRAERAEHHLDARAIVALLTEVVAKGGNLLLNVGPAADGTIPELQRTPLLEAGSWIRRHADLIHRARPWTHWGNDGVRYVVTERDEQSVGHRSPRTVTVIDVAGNGAMPHLGRAAGAVLEVNDVDGAPLTWEQDDHGTRVRRADRTPGGLAAVYRVELTEPPAAPIELFEPLSTTPVTLAGRLDGAGPGSVIHLGDGVHLGPVIVPPGVTVRGLGPDRTVIDGGGAAAVTLGAGARLEHAAVRGAGDRVAWFAVPSVVAAGKSALVLGCRIDGHVVVAADDVTVRATAAAGVVADGHANVTVSRSRLTGMRWDVGVAITGGFGHVIESCEIRGHLCGVLLDGTLEATVRGNVIDARWWGVRLVGTDASHVVGNAVTNTMRAIDVDGGTFACVDGNAVADGDSGCIVQRGAAGVEVSGNRWERCRIGLLAWDTADVRHDANSAVDLHEPDAAATIGP